MKLQTFLLTGLLVASLFSCKDKDDDANLPSCINKKIESFASSQDLCPNSAEVVEYRFNNELVYLFDTGDCIADAGYPVFDASCTERCMLGTIAGVTDCEGKNFYDFAEKVRVVWSNQ